MWFADVAPVGLDDEVLTLSVPSPLVRERLQHNHLSLIEDAAADVCGHPVKIEFVVDEGMRHPLAEATDVEPHARRHERPRPPRRHRSRAPIERSAPRACRSPTTRSTRSCPGRRNRFAHAAAMAVAEAPPSTAYNPLFIYGGVGLGKTHLLIAVGHHMYRLNPGIRVKYVTSEQFVTEFIKAVRERQGDAFRQRYREVDVLLVDDIQFLAKREETQTEFFHTFNHLHGAGQPDRDRVGPPAARALRPRGAAGQPVPLGPVRGRAAARPRDADRDPAAQGRARTTSRCPHDVVEFVASKFDQPSASSRARSCASSRGRELTRQPIDIELAERALQDLIPQTETEIPPQLILEETATYFTLVHRGPRVEVPLAAAHARPGISPCTSCASAPACRSSRSARSSAAATTRPPCTASRRSRTRCGPATPRSARSRTSPASSAAAFGARS